MRIYGDWAGNPQGAPEDMTRCIREVWPTDKSCWVPYQCKRRRGYGPHGLYCKQHAQTARPREYASEENNDVHRNEAR